MDVWRQAAALESALRQWELRAQRLNDEAADADSDAREQMLIVQGLRLRQQNVLEELQALVAEGVIFRASGAQQEHQELADDILAAESVLTDLKSASQQLHSDAKAAEGESERLHHRMFLCTCLLDFVRAGAHWEGKWQSWQQCAEQAHCRASQEHRSHNERASNEVYALCMHPHTAEEHPLPEAHGGSPAAGRLRTEQEALQAEQEATAALSEMRKSLNQADLLHSCMLSLSSADELVSRCCDAEQALNAALLDEQECKGTVESVRKTCEVELERVCAHLATACSPGLLPMVACFEELSEQSSAAREQLLSASQRVGERRVVLQKLQIQQYSCLHMEKLICVAHEHNRARKLALSEPEPSWYERTQPRLQGIDEHSVLPDSRESTLTVAGGIPRLNSEQRDRTNSSSSSEAYSGPQKAEMNAHTRSSAKKSKERGQVCYHFIKMYSTVSWCAKQCHRGEYV